MRNFWTNVTQTVSYGVVFCSFKSDHEANPKIPLPDFIFSSLSTQFDSVLEVSIKISELVEVLQGYYAQGSPLARQYCGMLGICGEKQWDTLTVAAGAALRFALKGLLSEGSPVSNKESEPKKASITMSTWNKQTFSVEEVGPRIKASCFGNHRVWDDWDTAMFIKVEEKARKQTAELNKAAHSRQVSETLPLFQIVAGKIKKENFSDTINHLKKKMNGLDKNQTGEIDFEEVRQLLISEYNFDPFDNAYYSDHFQLKLACF